MTIAHKLSEQFDISVLHPAEVVPFPFNLMKKYRNIASKDSWEDDGITVKPFKYIRLFGKKHAFMFLSSYHQQIEKLCKQHGIPQLIHAHYALPDGYFAYLLGKSFNIPYIISFRKTDIGFISQSKQSRSKQMMETVLANANHIIVHNAAQQETLSRLGFESTILPHGIEKDFFAKKSVENSSDNVTISCIGELVPAKHIDWVIEAVKNYQGDKKITLKIAGQGSMRNNLEKLAQGHDNIVFLGQIRHDRIGELLLQSDIFALPSVNETFGLVYLEAAAHQNAVIATKGTGIWGVFEDKEEMLYCESSKNFNDLLIGLIEDSDYRNSIAKKAFLKAQSQYTWDHIIDRYTQLYRTTLASE